MSRFPDVRLRRLRRTPGLRALVRETVVTPTDLVRPLFVVHGSGVREEVSSLPGVFRNSVDTAVADVRRSYAAGIRAVLLFGVPDRKDALGSAAWDDDGIVQRAVRALKTEMPDLVVMTDVCFCEYTSHGHCGVYHGGVLANDETLGLLARQAVSHARAGADVLAPSGMVDGMVGAIREALDVAGAPEVAVMSYSVKYASAFYGPFRDAVGSSPGEGDRRGYQMDPPNAREAVRESDLDVEEGADVLMVKPALPYLDVLRALRERHPHPLAAYQVSGEYAMIKAAAARGWLDERAAVTESLVALKRAGADVIISYFADDVARWYVGDYPGVPV